MDKKTIIGILIVMSIAVGCDTKNKDIVINYFPSTKLLKSQSFLDIEIIDKGPVHLLVVDTFLIVQKSQEKCIQIYSTNSHDLLTEFGLIGKGPGEFIKPELLSQITEPHENKKLIYIYDYSLNRLSTIDILECIKYSNFTIKEEKIPYVQTFITRFFYKDDSIFFATPEYGDRFIFYNYKTLEISKTAFLPKMDFTIEKSFLPNFYRSTCCVNTKERLIAAAPLFLGEVDLFDMSGKYIKSIIFEPRKIVSKYFTSNNIMKSKIYITKLVSSNNYIYGLYQNMNLENFELEEKKEFKIIVFSWMGEAIVEYNIFDYSIYDFAIDEIHERIYAISPQVNHIIYYDL